ncbi:MAG: hypothetical protein ACRELC_06860, partial [Gemmatimonadota bacterium]
VRLLADSTERIEPDLGATVVLLDPVAREGNGTGPRPADGDEEGESVVLESATVHFAPPFRAIRAGRPVRLVNAGPLAHRIFSADLDDGALDLPPDSGSVSLSLPPNGPIRFYCSLHPDETFLIFSSPSDHFALPDSTGGFRFPAVPAGRYTLSIWSEAIAGPVRQIEVRAARTTRAIVWLDPGLIP